MDRFTSMQVFVEAVDRGSYSSAAEPLGISSQMVGKHIRALENWLGTRLLQKSTRHQSLTEIGALFYDQCLVVLSSMHNAEQVTHELVSQPKGTLRLVAPYSFGHYILPPLLVAFQRKYPQILVDLHLSNRLVNVVEEGFDATIRMQSSADSMMVSRPLITYDLLLCAAPSYLSQAGVPAEPSDLTYHECLTGNFGQSDSWKFTRGKKTFVIKPKGALRINCWPTLMKAAISGAGITLQPAPIAQEELRTGKLVRVLPEYSLSPLELHLIYPQVNYKIPKLRKFSEFLLESLASPSLFTQFSFKQ